MFLIIKEFFKKCNVIYNFFIKNEVNRFVFKFMKFNDLLILLLKLSEKFLKI